MTLTMQFFPAARRAAAGLGAGDLSEIAGDIDAADVQRCGARVFEGNGLRSRGRAYDEASPGQGCRRHGHGWTSDHCGHVEAEGCGVGQNAGCTFDRHRDGSGSGSSASRQGQGTGGSCGIGIESSGYAARQAASRETDAATESVCRSDGDGAGTITTLRDSHVWSRSQREIRTA